MRALVTGDSQPEIGIRTARETGQRPRGMERERDRTDTGSSGGDRYMGGAEKGGGRETKRKTWI